MKTKKGFDGSTEDFIIESSSGDSSDEWDVVSENVPRSMLGAPVKDRAASRPDISKLPNGIGPDGIPVFVRGDKIVIERYSGVLQGHPYLDTRTYVIQSVDTVAGKIAMYDAAQGQFATDNWKVGLKNGNVYKLAKNVSLELSSRRKRGRPRKNPDTVSNAAKAPLLDASGMPIVKKRGRPAGSKNRSRDVIANEKAALREARCLRRNAKHVDHRRLAVKSDTKWIFLLPMNELLAELNG
jgi:hypothetical protein